MMLSTRGVQVPPPTPRKPLFGRGFWRVWSRFGRDLEGNRPSTRSTEPSSLGGERDENEPPTLRGARRETAGQRVETSTSCIGITPVLFVGVAGYDGHAHA